jgi:uncharacterized protein YndB with AHSA1/START domain
MRQTWLRRSRAELSDDRLVYQSLTCKSYVLYKMTRTHTEQGGNEVTQTTVLQARDYERTVRIGASAEQVYEAITTLDGLRGWWTPLVTGTPDVVSAEVRFEFEGLEEHILMRVEELDRPRKVGWRCLTHTSFPEWNGTWVVFAIEAPDSDGCELTLRHIGLAPDWDYFLASLGSYVEQGLGTPFGSDRAKEHR